MNPPDYFRRFRQCFPDLGSGNAQLDRLLSAATMQAHLDTFALEAAIIAKHGEIPDGTSLQDVVAARYGAEAVAFVRAAI